MTPNIRLTGPLALTAHVYAIAKLAGITVFRSYQREYGRSLISCLPTSLYGPGGHYDLETSHVLPAMIRRFHEAILPGAPTVTLRAAVSLGGRFSTSTTSSQSACASSRSVAIRRR
jgi:GDP-L-fucose synthase